ncbi:MAG TPA: lipid IV(A) 3-deoxy-D-manno-octulosonic acid transferase [Gammaproteobacteria bacterium]|nr:lipid IV(A) 3-deoxy-D-manno-octulosonic acid transferase [Gammaproteobacteria bacterium]
MLSYLLVPAALCALLWKGLRYRPYLRRWPERFAIGLERSYGSAIWVHAVSVGEVRSCVPLVRALVQRYPRHNLVLTTMTPTGAEQVSQLFGDAVRHLYLPYDLPDVVNRFLDRVRPSLAVIAETEFWPNLFAACRRRGIPLVLANVRISANSLSGYLRVPGIARAMFGGADLVCAQTRTDARRLRSLGVPEHRLFVTGNLKFDVPITDSVLTAGQELRQRWGAGRFIWIAGSTHAGEEEKILRAYRQLQARWSNLLLVLVPRDPERFSGVTRLVRRYGLRVARHSETHAVLAPEVDVLVGDSMGELQTFYAAADLAFVGASLVRRGGHNVLEPGAAGIPVIFGPHVMNFEDIAASVLEAGAGRQVYDELELAAAVEFYIGNPSVRTAAGAAARRAIARNGGCVSATLEHFSRQVHARMAARDAVRAGAAAPSADMSGRH